MANVGISFKMKLAFGILLGISAWVSASKTYENYKVLRTETLNSNQAYYLRDYMIHSSVDFWKEPIVNQSADIMVGPETISDVTTLLSSLDIKYTLMIPNVRQLIKNAQKTENDETEMNWTDYHSHQTINKYIDDLATNHSDWMKTVSIGKTYEGRDMRVLQINKAGPSKPIVWMEAGIHAREWIASAVATYVIDQIVNSDDGELLNNLNFHILPNGNPDGYTYSREHDRLWRKTRSSNEGSLCKGTDPNRNWDFHWSESGVSKNPCSELYPGAYPFSEIEMVNIKNYLLENKIVPILSHCFHSYSQLWLWPYGYDYDTYPDNYLEIKTLAEKASKALKAVHGTVFKTINSADLYPAGGASDDWYKGVLNSRFAYTTELRDTGKYGFILPSEEIIPSGEEIWAGLTVVFKEMIRLSKEPLSV